MKIQSHRDFDRFSENDDPYKKSDVFDTGVHPIFPKFGNLFPFSSKPRDFSLESLLENREKWPKKCNFKIQSHRNRDFRDKKVAKIIENGPFFDNFPPSS